MGKLAKLVATPILIAGGIGALSGFGGWTNAVIKNHTCESRIERLEDYQKYLLTEDSSPQYNEISEEISSMKAQQESIRNFGLYSFGLMFSSLLVGTGAAYLGEYLERMGEKIK